MPKYVIERQYLLPIYQRLMVEADTLEEACRKALENTCEVAEITPYATNLYGKPVTIDLAAKKS